MFNIIESLKASLTKHQHKVRERQFLEAAMGACAVLSLADGEISFAELIARDYLLDNVKRLQLFDPNEAAEVFRTYAEALEADHETEKAKILETVGEFAKDAELAPLLMRICIAIAIADRDFSSSEQRVVSQLGQVLGLEESALSNLLKQAGKVTE